MTTTELIDSMTDPRQALELQRKATLAAFDGFLAVQAEGHKLTQQAWKHTPSEDWAKPMRQAGEEMANTTHDLTRRALEVSRTEVERWYGTFLGS